MVDQDAWGESDRGLDRNREIESHELRVTDSATSFLLTQASTYKWCGLVGLGTSNCKFDFAMNCKDIEHFCIKLFQVNFTVLVSCFARSAPCFSVLPDPAWLRSSTRPYRPSVSAMSHPALRALSALRNRASAELRIVCDVLFPSPFGVSVPPTSALRRADPARAKEILAGRRPRSP